MEWIRKILIGLIGLLLAFVAAWLSTIVTKSCSTPQIQQVEIVKTDTLVVERIDTIVVEKPMPYKVTVVDTIYVDSFQSVPFWKVLVQEVKEYGDSTYYARISGINAHLEEWRTYPKTVTKYITNTERVVVEPKKWGSYGNAEYGFTSVDSRLCIGAELRYIAPKVEYFIKGGRELIRNQSYIEVGANIPIVRW